MRCQSATSNAKQKDRLTEMRKKETIMWSIHIIMKKERKIKNKNNNKKYVHSHSLFFKRLQQILLIHKQTKKTTERRSDTVFQVCELCFFFARKMGA